MTAGRRAGRRAAMLAAAVVMMGAVPATLASAAGAAAASQTTLRTPLSGAEAVPPGDPDGSGEAIVVVRNQQVCFRIIAKNIDPIIAIHIHEAARGQTGPHAVDLEGQLLTIGPGDQVFVGCVDGGDKAAELAAFPSRFYINVHSHEFIQGAVRGQLARLG